MGGKTAFLCYDIQCQLEVQVGFDGGSKKVQAKGARAPNFWARLPMELTLGKDNRGTEPREYMQEVHNYLWGKITEAQS